MHGSNGVSGDQLRSIIERVERLDDEIRDINNVKSETFKEAKGNGYDVKVLKRVIAMRRMDRDKRREEEEILDLYLAALGMVD